MVELERPACHMTATFLKFLHIAAIALWTAGLICLPHLNRQRSEVGEQTDLHRLHSMVRFFYVVILSPAAFVGILTGTALIYVQETFTVWFTLKLALVGALVAVHLRTGHVILRLFDESVRWSPWRHTAMTVLTVTIASGIVLVVLTKPAINARALQTNLFAPGQLRSLFNRDRESESTSTGGESNLPSLAQVNHQADTLTEHELATMPTGNSGEDRSEHRQGEPMRQHLFGTRQPQAPIGPSDRQHRHGCNGVGPTADPLANAFDCEQLHSSEHRSQQSQPERESRAPNSGTQEEGLAEEPIKDVDSQRGEH